MAWEFNRVAGPYEGPANGVVWDGSAILFSLMEAQLVMSFDPETRETKQVRKYANRVNGLGLGPNGELYGCQEGGRRLVQFMPDGRMTAVDALLDGRHHNHPSDLAVDKAGNIWFADPHSRTLAFGPQIFPALDHASVLRLEKNERRAWALTRITYDTVAPRAVALSADEKTLYVAEGEPGRNGPRELRAYPIGSEGVGPYRLMHTFGSDHRGPHRGLEGLALDRDGNIVGCGGWRKSGPGPLLYVFAPSGAVIETHPFPADLPNRCCFGGKDRDRLYVTTAGGELYEAKIGRRGG